MMARRSVFGILAGGVAAVLSGCGLSGRDSYHFKMTVEVDTPEGLRTGSSVYEVEGIGTSDLITGGSGSYAKLRGEAVAVDLPDRKTLFALLRMANGTSADDHVGIMSMRTMDPAMRNAKKDQSARRIASGDGIKSPAEVAPENYPMLVIFKDMNDPTSVGWVEPAVFGVKRIIVEVTDEQVTNGIENRLNKGFWINKSRIHKQEMTKNGGIMTNPYFQSIAGKISRNDFTTENFR